MKPIAWLFKWLLKAAIFFTLFAFALNNQSDVTVRFFFGQQWTAPMVLVVLGAFAAGLLVGVLGMVPRWWRQRRQAHAALQTPIEPVAPQPAPAPVAAEAYSESTLHGV
jgi:lipopolysaccharide assembly protein A